MTNDLIKRAADLLRNGQLVALPTETVYGLAANAFDPDAVASIYTAKGRPSNNPIIVHVTGIEMAKRCVADWPKEATILAENFWPGPLSIILPRASTIPDVVTGGGSTVAVRAPRHPIFRAVLEKCDFPLAAPSANRSNHISPTTAEHVHISLGDRVPLILDGGACQVGIESTVVLLTDPRRPKILRPGAITEDQILSALGITPKNIAQTSSVPANIPSNTALPSPGMLKRHYSPKTPTYLWNPKATSLRNTLSAIRQPSENCALIALEPIDIPFATLVTLPNSPALYAENIYATLYRCDSLNLRAIIIQSPPNTPEWRAVLDRLGRAAAR